MRQGLCKISFLWGIFNGLHPQTCSGVSTLLKHDRHRRRGVGGSCRVRGTPEEGGERVVVYFDAGMGGSARSKGVGTMEILWTWYWRQVERLGRRKRLSVQQRSRPEDGDHVETGINDSGGTFREPPLPLDEKWKGRSSCASTPGDIA